MCVRGPNRRTSFVYMNKSLHKNGNAWVLVQQGKGEGCFLSSNDLLPRLSPTSPIQQSCPKELKI